MYGDSFICMQIARSDIRPHVKWAVSLVIAGDKYSSSGICMCRVYVTIRANIRERSLFMDGGGGRGEGGGN